jgi:hypothetical protein
MCYAQAEGMNGSQSVDNTSHECMLYIRSQEKEGIESIIIEHQLADKYVLVSTYK